MATEPRVATERKAAAFEPLAMLDAWSAREDEEATETLRRAVWPRRGEDIYDAVTKGQATFRKSFEEVVHDARILQRALLLAKHQGRFEELSLLLSQGISGMEACIPAAESRGGVPVITYQKAAGDKLVHFWCRQHLAEMRHAFDNNATEAMLTSWLQLPRLVLQSAVAEEVEQWNTHNSADFLETFTLYLPSEILNLLMNVAVNFFQFCDRRSNMAPTCRLRSADGLLLCSRKVRGSWDGYCGYTHWMEAQQQGNRGSPHDEESDSRARAASSRPAGTVLEEAQVYTDVFIHQRCLGLGC